LSTGLKTLLVGLAVLAADQIAKQVASDTLSTRSGADPSAFAGWLSLTYTTNQGAAFGAFAGSGVLFLLIAAAVVAVVVVSTVWFPTSSRAMIWSLGLQLGGATANIVDRVRLGFVVDFIHIKYWPVFNLADAAIVVGAGLFVWTWVGQSAPTINDDVQSSPN
jgi:signal peptidase II